MISIFIIDDHAIFREGLRQILSRQPDMRVDGEAGSGGEALSIISGQSFDVVLLDISLPDLSGWNILSEIKRVRPSSAVLILSMHPEDQYAVRMLHAGAAGYVSKERAADELLTAIRKVAGGGKYVTEAVAQQLAEEVDASRPRQPHELLSNREFQVMCMLAAAKSLREIAEELCLSEKTVTTYRSRILEKLNLRNNVDITHYVIQNKLHSS